MKPCVVVTGKLNESLGRKATGLKNLLFHDSGVASLYGIGEFLYGIFRQYLPKLYFIKGTI